MRYFLNTSAARPAVVAGQKFEFELVGLRGGSWLGILALDEPGASILAEARWPNTDEITEEVYLLQKKKLSVDRPNSPAWPRPTPQPPNLAIADRAASPTSRGDSDGRAPNPATVPGGGPNSTSGVSAVSLMTTSNTPPAEPLLAETAVKRRRF